MIYSWILSQKRRIKKKLTGHLKEQEDGMGDGNSSSPKSEDEQSENEKFLQKKKYFISLAASPPPKKKKVSTNILSTDVTICPVDFPSKKNCVPLLAFKHEKLYVLLTKCINM